MAIYFLTDLRSNRTFITKVIALLFLCQVLALTLLAQDIIELSDVSDRTGGVNKTLPFDRPVIVKYTTGEPLIINSCLLVRLKKKKNIREFYNNLMETKFIDPSTMETPLNFRTIPVTVGDKTKYELNISVPPLRPYSFYDIWILRRPNKTEATMFFEIFRLIDRLILAFGSGATDAVITELRNSLMKQIGILNEVKKPFSLINDNNEPQIDELSDFFGNNLVTLYANLRAAATPAAYEAVKGEIIEYIQSYKFPPGESDLLVFFESLSMTTMSMSFDTRTTYSITPDFGYVYYGFGKNFYGIVPYLGLQIEFRYFDKNVPFWLIRNKNLLHYLSFTAGITLSALKKEGKREDLFGGKSLLLGLGFRLTNAVRITGGTILFNKEDPNPYYDRKTLGATPFVGLSIDLKIRSLINDLTGLNFVNRK